MLVLNAKEVLSPKKILRKMKSLSILIVAYFGLLNGIAYGQKYTFDSSAPKTVIQQVKSKDGIPYELTITLPPDYDPENEYKILYYLDAWWFKDLIPGCYRLKSLSNKSVENNLEELILVGISSVGTDEDWNRQRNMDFTPSKSLMKLSIKQGNVEINEKTTGGAEKFLIFLKDEVIKSIEGQYKVDSSSRTIFGHSFGGLFGFYAYLNENSLFSNYILISPSIWWNQSELLANKEYNSREKRVNMFVAVGTNEAKILKDAITKFADEVNQEKNTNINLQYKQYEGANHHSLLPQSIYDAIGIIYTK